MAATHGYQKHNDARLAASIAFYGILSAAPLAVILVTVGGFFFGQKASEGLIIGPLKTAVGQEGARAMQSLIASAYRSPASVPATILAVLVLLFSGTRLIGDIRGSLNAIWEVPGHAGGGFKGFLVGKLIDVGMIFVLALLFLGTLLANAAVTTISRHFASAVPFPAAFLQISGIVFSLAVIIGVLAVVFRVLPNLRLGWRDVVLGAVLSAFLFEIGNYVIGLYLGRSSTASVFGAAGSFAVLMIWMYYSANIVLFGVEVTRANRQRRRGGPKLDGIDLQARINAASGPGDYSPGHPTVGNSAVPPPRAAAAPKASRSWLGGAIGAGIAVVFVLGYVFGKRGPRIAPLHKHHRNKKASPE